MISKVYSAVLLGINAPLVKIETDIPSSGMPGWHMVGLLETAVKEAKERVASAIRNSGFTILNRKTIINLAPGHIKKTGVHFDLPIAVGLLCAWNIVNSNKAKKYLFAGELSLTGNILPITGTLLISVTAKEKGFDGIIIPEANIQEARLVSGINIIGVSKLSQVVDFLNNDIRPQNKIISSTIKPKKYIHDFSEVKGQTIAKKGLEIAASGGHNVLLYGPPGTGKTMLAERLSTILPKLSYEEALETLKIMSAYGIMDSELYIDFERPFRAPHHSASYAGLVGGGSTTYPKLGEISLAHNGVLFLDEIPEFNRDVLEVLRQPLESGFIRISRMGVSISYPANFILVAAMNPCRCGYFGHSKKPCTCSIPQIRAYRNKISGPLLDRIDMHIHVPTIAHEEIFEERALEKSEEIRKRVINAREIQEERYEGEVLYNAALKGKLIQKYCHIDKPEKKLLKNLSSKMSLSARSVHKILKLSRTIADLEQSNAIKEEHIAQAIQFRTFDPGIT